MKTSAKLSIALVVALILSFAAISVWAAPSRQGTVPIQPDVLPISGLGTVNGGTFNVTLLGNCGSKGTLTREKYLTGLEKDFGKAPTGSNYLTDGVKIQLNGACDIQVCFPYPKDYETKGGQIYKWDGKAWVLLTSTISGDPKKICVTDKGVQTDSYSLLGK
jgi:hypothetical protein